MAIGDSFTEGGSATQIRTARAATAGWADRVAEELARGHEDFAYANLAIRGRMLQQIIDEQIEPALALKPDLISICRAAMT